MKGDTKDRFTKELRGIDFVQNNFGDYDFSNVSIRNCTFTDCDMRHCTFEGSELINVQWKRGTLIGTKMANTSIINCLIRKTDVTGMTFTGVTLNTDMYERVDVCEGMIINTTDDIISFKKLNGEFNDVKINADIEKSKIIDDTDKVLFFHQRYDKRRIIRGLDFVGLNWRGYDLSDCEFNGCRFTDMDMRKCNLCDGDIFGCDFDNVDLSGSLMKRSIMYGCKFKSSKLEECNCDDMKIRSVYFGNTIFTCISTVGMETDNIQTETNKYRDYLHGFQFLG